MRTTAERPLVVVTLGTDHHPFGRLLAMVQDWAVAHPAVEVVVQCGHTPPPAGLDAVEFMAPDELASLFARASAVVTHGGPSSIMEARAHGHVPIVVARDPDLGEHVDGHQLRFVSRVGEDGLVRAVQTPDALAEVLDASVAQGPPTEPCPDRPEAVASVERIAELLDELIESHTTSRRKARS